ncbi:MAG: HPP family protein [Gemmatimonadetes bacterium]|nr:HPP family protein [Gemmatimonadota bacterium]
MPTVTTLVVLAFVESVTVQRLLFASLAASAFLIYLDPRHATNSIRTLLIAQGGGALLGWLTYDLLGPGYLAAGAAVVATIAAMLLLDAVHPPAVATAMGFALRAGNARNLALFAIALAITAVLVVLQQVTVWLLDRELRRGAAPPDRG